MWPLPARTWQSYTRKWERKTKRKSERHEPKKSELIGKKGDCWIKNRHESLSIEIE